MKKITAICAAALVAAMSLSAAACTGAPAVPNTPVPADNRQTDTSARPDNTSIAGSTADTVKVTPEVSKVDMGMDYQFIRVTYSETANSQPPVVITSVEELNTKVIETLETDEQKRLVMEKYNEEFFASHFLVTFYVTYSSGSTVPKVDSAMEKDGKLLIQVHGESQGVGTSDMATHLALVELDAAKFPKEAEASISGAGYVSSTGSKTR